MADEKTPAQIWRQEEIKKAKEAKIAEAKADSPAYNGPHSVEEEETLSDWQRLIAISRIKFPDHLASQFNLTPNQRLACVAHCLGWPADKISTAAKIGKRTVYAWLKKDEAVEFVKAFNYHNGTSDAKELIDKELYASIQTIKDLRDDPTVSASTRLQCAQWLWEQKYGKAKEVRETKGINLRDLTDAINQKKKNGQTTDS